MYGYLMHHQLQQQGKRRRRSSFFRSRRNSQESNNSNPMAHELSGEQQQQQQEQELGSSRRRRQQGGDDNNSNNNNFNSNTSYGNDSREINNNDDYSNTHTGEQRFPKQQQHQRNNHAWILPPHVKLASRMDIWMMLTVSSCAAVASICQSFVSAPTSSSNNNSSFSGGDTVALSTCILTFLTSFLMACGVRYTPFRKGMTRSLFVNNPGAVSRLHLTMELVVLTVLSILWIVSMPVIVNGNAYYNSSMVSRCYCC
jgi:hypothetical protein